MPAGVFMNFWHYFLVFWRPTEKNPAIFSAFGARNDGDGGQPDVRRVENGGGECGFSFSGPFLKAKPCGGVHLDRLRTSRARFWHGILLGQHGLHSVEVQSLRYVLYTIYFIHFLLRFFLCDNLIV